MTNFTGWIKSLFIFIYNILLRNKLWQSFDLALAWIIVIAQLSFVMHVNNDKKVMLVNIVICFIFALDARALLMFNYDKPSRIFLKTG